MNIGSVNSAVRKDSGDSDISLLVMFGKSGYYEVHVGIKLLIQDIIGLREKKTSLRFVLGLQSAVTPVRPEHRYMLSVVGGMRS